MKKIFFAILLLAGVCYSNAQTIQGYVFANSDPKPVEFANVLLLNLPDSSMIKGVITYTDGQYTLDQAKPGNYYIKASFMGYKANGVPIEVKEGESIILADTIYLKEETQKLDEVVVTGEYVRAKELVDRTVYEILPEIEEVSTNGYDVLKKIPSVQVDFNNNITMNGHSNFLILVDGKKRDKEFLARILPTDIESVELIHNPSGKYEGDVEGVINIILKPEARVGINGSVGFQLKPVGKPTYVGFGSLDYGREKISFYASGYTFNQNLNVSGSTLSRMSLAETDSVLNIAANGDLSMSATGINTGLDFYPDEHNTISLNYSFKPFTNVMDLFNGGHVLLDADTVNIQESESTTATGSFESDISLYYRKKFKKPIQELTWETDYYFFNSEDDNDFAQYLFDVDRIETQQSFERSEITINDRKYLSSRIDYVQPIGVSTRIEFGYQFYRQQMDYNHSTTDVNSSNDYNYIELRNAAYASFYWNLNKFSLQTTIRAEDSRININDSINSNYTTPLPSANLMYKLNSKHNLKFTYNRRINRPDIYRLNPFVKLNNDLSISSGNPELKPEYKDRLQLTYTMNIKKINVAPYLYHEFYSNKIDNLTSLTEYSTGQLTLLNKPENILTGYEQGIGLNATIIFMNINGSIYKGHFNEYTDGQTSIEEKDYFSYRISGNAYAPLFKKKLNVFAFAHYNGVMRSAQTLTYSPFFYGAGLQQNIKNHSWGVVYLLPLAKTIQFQKFITETEYVYSENVQNFDASWFIQVFYSYKFNKGRSIKKTKHKGETESDTKEGGGIGR